MRDPRTHAHHRPRRHRLPANDRRAARRHHPLERQAKGRVQAARFLDAGVQIGQLAGRGPRHDWGGGIKIGGVVVELGAEAGEGVGVLGEVEEDGAEVDGGGVAAGEDVGGGPGGEGPGWFG